MRVRAHSRRLWLVALGVTSGLFGAWAAWAVTPRDWRLRPEQIGVSADALRLPDRAFSPQGSRGWQFVSAPLTATGERGLLATSDGVFWNFELRALVKKDAGVAPLVGFVFSYENEGSYGALLWDTRAGDLTLRTLRDKRATELARGKAAFGDQAWASLVLRAVMGDIAGYVNGEKVLTASAPSLLGRVAVFALGGEAVCFDGVEVRSLHPQAADADVFGRSRRAFETQCAGCHELYGPWDSNHAPDDWESVVNQMLSTEGADEFIARGEADRITDYLRVISLHPDRNRYRPREEP